MDQSKAIRLLEDEIADIETNHEKYAAIYPSTGIRVQALTEALNELKAIRDRSCMNCKKMVNGYCKPHQRKMTGNIDSISKSLWLKYISCDSHEYETNHSVPAWAETRS